MAIVPHTLPQRLGVACFAAAMFAAPAHAEPDDAACSDAPPHDPDRAELLRTPNDTRPYVWLGDVTRYKVPGEDEWRGVDAFPAMERARGPFYNDTHTSVVLCRYGICALHEIDEHARALAVQTPVPIVTEGDARVTLRPGARAEQTDDGIVWRDRTFIVSPHTIPADAVGPVAPPASGPPSDPSGHHLSGRGALYGSEDAHHLAHDPVLTWAEGGPALVEHMELLDGQPLLARTMCRVAFRTEHLEAEGWINCTHIAEGPLEVWRIGVDGLEGWGCGDCTLVDLAADQLLWDATHSVPIARVQSPSHVRQMFVDACGWTRVSFPSFYGPYEAWAPPGSVSR
jgi:hypothetical protein